MKANIWLTALFCTFATIATGQFGGGVKYQQVDNPYWEEAIADLSNGFYAQDIVSASAYYWFRLKELRVEFMPEIGYGMSLGQNHSGISTDLSLLNALLNVHVYPFDLVNDCDCPTFSKQGGDLQKGFFIEFTGGLDHQMIELKDASDANLYDGSESMVRFGVGVGLDLGISDLFTLTPTVFKHWSGQPQYEGLAEALGGESVEECDCRTSYFGVGLRAIFRPDYLKRR